MNRYLIAALATLLALAPAAWAAETSSDATEAAAPAALLPAVTVVPVERLRLSDRIVASGQIGPVERVFVQPQIEGQAINEVLAEVGDTVEAGQVLARLSGSALDLQLSQLRATRASVEASIAQADAQLIDARSAWDEARRVAERTERLRAQGTTSQAQADQADAAATSARARVTVAEQGRAAAVAQLELADAQLADVELRLGYTEIVAPVGGIVIERNARIGAIASAAGQPLFVIMRDGALELIADVAERDVLRLKPGQPASLRIVGLSTPVEGSVRLVVPTVDPLTRMGQVRVAITTPLDSAVTGLFAEGTIIAAEADGLALPVTSVALSDGGASVLRVGPDGRVARVAVTTGIRDGGMIQITDGLAEGDMIVARAGAFVRDGDRVRAVPAASGTN